VKNNRCFISLSPATDYDFPMSKTYRNGLSVGCDDDVQRRRSLLLGQNPVESFDVTAKLASLRTELMAAIDAKMSAFWKEVDKRDAAMKIAISDAVGELKDLYWSLNQPAPQNGLSYRTTPTNPEQVKKWQFSGVPDESA
jgi:hypothetical protein